MVGTVTVYVHNTYGHSNYTKLLAGENVKSLPQQRYQWGSNPRPRLYQLGVRGVVQIKASLRNSHFGALGQRPTPTTGHNIAFHTLRHVLRPAIREGTRYTLLLFAGWGARGPWGGTSKISPFSVLPIIGINKFMR